MGLAQIYLKTPYKNSHFSVSRIKQYVKCNLAYKFSYPDQSPRGSNEAGDFGKMVHGALEEVFDWIINEEHVGPVSDERLIECFRIAFEFSDVSSNAFYKEGLEMFRNYFRLFRNHNHMKIMAVEHGFETWLGQYKVIGYIDRIDWINKDTVHIIDYKTNRQMFSRDDLENDLQMSVYGLAIKETWPWVKHVRYSFDMLRHNQRQNCHRTDQDLQDARDYVIATANRIESQTEFRPKLNILCAWCDHRHKCDEYNEALTSGESSLSYLVASGNLDKVCAERERAVALRKIAEMRKNEMDKILKASLVHGNQREIVRGGIKYKMIQSSDTVYDRAKVIETLSKGLRIPKSVIEHKIGNVEKKKIEKLISEANLPSVKRSLLWAQISAAGEKVAKRPFVGTSKAKGKVRK